MLPKFLATCENVNFGNSKSDRFVIKEDPVFGTLMFVSVTL